MASPDGPTLPPGRPPWDPWNGARVGAVLGAIGGLVLSVLLSNASFWLVPIGALIGGAFGFRDQRRRQATQEMGHDRKSESGPRQ